MAAPIENDEQCLGAIKEMGALYRSLLSLRDEIRKDGQGSLVGMMREGIFLEILGYHANPPFAQNFLLRNPVVGEHCARLMELFDVRPRLPGLRSSSFSGGNQQKLVLAREMAHGPKVLLVGQPTRGVDIGAIEFIHRELVKARDAGCAVLVVSVELDEILALADRVVVMFAGRVAGELPVAEADERTLGLMMAGAATGAAA